MIIINKVGTKFTFTLIAFHLIFFLSIIFIGGFPQTNDIVHIFKISSLDSNLKFVNGLYGPGYTYYSLIFSNSLKVLSFFNGFLNILSSVLICIFLNKLFKNSKNDEKVAKEAQQNAEKARQNAESLQAKVQSGTVTSTKFTRIVPVQSIAKLTPAKSLDMNKTEQNSRRRERKHHDQVIATACCQTVSPDSCSLPCLVNLGDLIFFKEPMVLQAHTMYFSLHNNGLPIGLMVVSHANPQSQIPLHHLLAPCFP
mgnify:CR=1 FL=1